MDILVTAVSLLHLSQVFMMFSFIFPYCIMYSVDSQGLFHRDLYTSAEL